MPQDLGADVILGTRDAAGLVVEEPQVMVHEGQQPDLVAELADGDRLADEDVTQVISPPTEAGAAAAGDEDRSVVDQERRLEICTPSVAEAAPHCEIRLILYFRLVRQIEGAAGPPIFLTTSISYKSTGLGSEPRAPQDR